MISVLFVCLGNICRSPLAEAAFRKSADRAGLVAECDSAAIRNWHEGSPPDKRSIAVARNHGLDIRQQRSRPVVREDFIRFSHIIGMDSANLSALRAMAPADGRAHLSLLLDHLPGREGEDIDDPWYGRASAFEKTWLDVSAATDALVRGLIKSG